MGYVMSALYADLYEGFIERERPLVSRQGYLGLVGMTRRMLIWFDSEDIVPTAITIQDAVRYQAHLSEMQTKEGNPIMTGTMQNYVKVARRFFKYLVETDRIKTNPFADLPYPRIGEHLSRNGLTESQMNCLLSELVHFDKLPTVQARLRRYRVHVISEFLYATGLRIAEACSLIESNLDLDHRLVYLPEGKGGKARTAFLNGYASEVMKLYIAKGRKEVLGGYIRGRGDTLFGADKARVAFIVNEELKSVCTTLCIPVITTHGFRHSLGTHLLRSGCDMRHIQVILGHEALGTTQIYTKVNKDDLKRSLDTFHPRQWSHDGVAK